MTLNLTLFNIIGILIIFTSNIVLLIKNNNIHKKYKLINFIGTMFILLFIVFSNIYAYSKVSSLTNNKEKTVITTNKKKGTETFDKASSVNKMTNILKDIQSETNGKFEDKINMLSDGNVSLKEIYSPKILDYFYLTDYLVDNENAQRTALIGLVSFVKAIEEQNNKNIELIYDKIDYVIYLDDVSKTAQIPANIYMGNIGSISFQMIYVNKEWKLAPYTMLESLSLSAQIQNNTDN